MTDREQTRRDAEAVDDLVLIKDALIIVGGFLPFFSGDEDKVARATRADSVRQDAFAALNRMAARLGLPPPARRVSKERMKP